MKNSFNKQSMKSLLYVNATLRHLLKWTKHTCDFEFVHLGPNVVQIKSVYVPECECNFTCDCQEKILLSEFRKWSIQKNITKPLIWGYTGECVNSYMAEDYQQYAVKHENWYQLFLLTGEIDEFKITQNV